MAATKHINQLEVKVGDVVHFHGARFEIIERKEYAETQQDLIDIGRTVYVSAIGKWLDGDVVRGYFGPDKNWNFQGNCGVTLLIEA